MNPDPGKSKQPLLIIKSKWPLVAAAIFFWTAFLFTLFFLPYLLFTSQAAVIDWIVDVGIIVIIGCGAILMTVVLLRGDPFLQRQRRKSSQDSRRDEPPSTN